jgi:transporter family-2 protein
VVAGGCLLPVQASLNAAVAHVAGSSPFAAAISFGIGFLALVTITALGPIGRPQLGTLREAPFWAYLGGLTGAWFIFLGALLLPTLGATRMMGMVVGGQLLMGLVIDHFGWLGIPARPLTPRRRTAAVLVVVAVALLSGAGACRGPRWARWPWPSRPAAASPSASPPTPRSRAARAMRWAAP